MVSESGKAIFKGFICWLGALAVPGVLIFDVGAVEEEYRISNVVVTDPWARGSIPKVPNGTAYMTISVEGSESDWLIKVTTPLAKKAAIHTNIMESGVIKMREIKAAEVIPGKPTTLQPGGLHIMLIGLNRRLSVGETFPLTLYFQKAGHGDIEVVVRGPGETANTSRHPQKGKSK